nr:uncharacterized protein LOC117866636 [Setaria viridis]
MEELNVKDDLTYTEYPIKIMDALARVTRNRVIREWKVQWSHHAEDEAIWEREDEVKKDHSSKNLKSKLLRTLSSKSQSRKTKTTLRRFLEILKNSRRRCATSQLPVELSSLLELYC